MSRKASRPSLKNYLTTGKVIIEELSEPSLPSDIDIDKSTSGDEINAEMILALFSAEDSNTWEPIFKAGAEIKKEKIDLVELRDFFRIMDRARFTLYVLKNEKTAMQIIRSSVQIREPFILFLLWDDTGVASIYINSAS